MMDTTALRQRTVYYLHLSLQASRRLWKHYWRHYWKGTLAIFVATAIFFGPWIVRIGTYNEGGDSMFNAWVMARNQHCILRENCANYYNANIFYPHSNSMLYSETEIAPAVVTLPLYLIAHNPILDYNVITIASFFAMGLFMYWLVKYLSKGNEALSILAGLVYEFAPLRIPAVAHLQNHSILCLALAVLLVLKYIQTRRRVFAVALLPVLLYVFFASWEQMVFVAAMLVVLLAGLLLLRFTTLRSIIVIVCVIVMAAAPTLPIALHYIAFAKAQHASFGIDSQELYNSAVVDYLKPFFLSIEGKIYFWLRPGASRGSFNLDSLSYSGFLLYGLLIVSAVTLYRLMRRRDREGIYYWRLLVVLLLLGMVGLFISLGPFLRIRGDYLYHVLGNQWAVIPLPYVLIDKFLPQLRFIRAVGRASALVLFVLAANLGIIAVLMRKYFTPQAQKVATVVLYIVAIFELMPLSFVPMGPAKYDDLSLPKVYQYIEKHPEVDDIVVLRTNPMPPTPLPDRRDPSKEDMLWAAYDNRYIFNGYSGYQPPDYMSEYEDFVRFDSRSVAEMKSLHLHYVIVDKPLSNATDKYQALLPKVQAVFPLIYQDSRYALFKIQ